MKLFHQLETSDQHNAIHYCMHIVVEDMLSDGVELEAFSEEDQKIKNTLEKVVAEAKVITDKQEQFEFLVEHKEAGQMIFDLSLDMARSAYYHADDELVIYNEALRVPAEEPIMETVEDLIDSSDNSIPIPKKTDHSLN